MKNYRKRKSILCVLIWLAGLAVISSLFYKLEMKHCTENAHRDLTDQAHMIAEQMPSILENEYYTQFGSLRM